MTVDLRRRAPRGSAEFSFAPAGNCGISHVDETPPAAPQDPERLPDRDPQVISHSETQPSDSARVSVTHGADLTQLATAAQDATVSDGSQRAPHVGQACGCLLPVPMTPEDAARALRSHADAILAAGIPVQGLRVLYAYATDQRTDARTDAERAAAYRARKRVTPNVTNRDEIDTKAKDLPQTPSRKEESGSSALEEGISKEHAVSSSRTGAGARASGADRHVTDENQRDVTKRVRTAGRKGFPPADFAPKDSHRSLASERNVDLALETAKFKDHEFQRKITDWDRTFANWLRNANSSAGRPLRPADIRQRTTTPFDFSKVTANGKGGVY